MSAELDVELTTYLDIGCGNGRYLRVLADEGLSKDRIYGIEAERQLKRKTQFFGKEGHTESLVRSGHFALVRALFLHALGETSAEHFVRGFETLEISTG